MARANPQNIQLNINSANQQPTQLNLQPPLNISVQSIEQPAVQPIVQSVVQPGNLFFQPAQPAQPVQPVQPAQNYILHQNPKYVSISDNIKEKLRKMFIYELLDKPINERNKFKIIDDSLSKKINIHNQLYSWCSDNLRNSDNHTSRNNIINLFVNLNFKPNQYIVSYGELKLPHIFKQIYNDDMMFIKFFEKAIEKKYAKFEFKFNDSNINIYFTNITKDVDKYILKDLDKNITKQTDLFYRALNNPLDPFTESYIRNREEFVYLPTTN